MATDHSEVEEGELVLECLRQQLDEYDILRSIFGERFIAKTPLSFMETLRSSSVPPPSATTTCGAAPNASVGIPSAKARCIEYGLVIAGEAPQLDSTCGRVRDLPFSCQLNIRCPRRSYPVQRSPDWTVDIPAKEEHDIVLQVLHRTVRNCQGCTCVLQMAEDMKNAVSLYRENMAEVLRVQWEEQQSATRVAEVDGDEGAEAFDLSEQELACAGALTAPNGRLQLGRRCIFYHHIVSVFKRRCIIKWAAVLRLAGYCKVGYPGILIVEGPEPQCCEYVRFLQSLRWKLMVVRGEEQIPVCAPSATLDSMRRIPLVQGVVETAESSQLAAMCSSAGLTDLFLTSMKIYR